MSNLEHLIENGLCHLSEGKSYREWREIMQQDCNWEGNENITIDNLWEICQYVVFTWGKGGKKMEIDRDDIIYGLSEISLFLSNLGREDFAQTIEDACGKLALLNEQEAKTVKETLVVGEHLMGKCPRCSKILTVQDHPVACGFCGQAVQWG